MLLSEIGYEERDHNAWMDRIKQRKLSTITAIIEAVAELYVGLYNLEDAEAINHGMCEDFAEDVVSLVPGAETYWLDELGETNAAHKVVKYQESYYDSQCPEGVKNWRELERN